MIQSISVFNIKLQNYSRSFTERDFMIVFPITINSDYLLSYVLRPRYAALVMSSMIFSRRESEWAASILYSDTAIKPTLKAEYSQAIAGYKPYTIVTPAYLLNAKARLRELVESGIISAADGGEVMGLFTLKSAKHEKSIDIDRALMGELLLKQMVMSEHVKADLQKVNTEVAFERFANRVNLTEGSVLLPESAKMRESETGTVQSVTAKQAKEAIVNKQEAALMEQVSMLISQFVYATRPLDRHSALHDLYFYAHRSNVTEGILSHKQQLSMAELVIKNGFAADQMFADSPEKAVKLFEDIVNTYRYSKAEVSDGVWGEKHIVQAAVTKGPIGQKPISGASFEDIDHAYRPIHDGSVETGPAASKLLPKGSIEREKVSGKRIDALGHVEEEMNGHRVNQTGSHIQDGGTANPTSEDADLIIAPLGAKDYYGASLPEEGAAKIDPTEAAVNSELKWGSTEPQDSHIEIPQVHATTEAKTAHIEVPDVEATTEPVSMHVSEQMAVEKKAHDTDVTETLPTKKYKNAKVETGAEASTEPKNMHIEDGSEAFREPQYGEIRWDESTASKYHDADLIKSTDPVKQEKILSITDELVAEKNGKTVDSSRSVPATRLNEELADTLDSLTADKKAKNTDSTGETVADKKAHSTNAAESTAASKQAQSTDSTGSIAASLREEYIQTIASVVGDKEIAESVVGEYYEAKQKLKEVVPMEAILSVKEFKELLIQESMPGKGLLYDPHGYRDVLDSPSDPSEWDGGYGVPLDYDPQDPFNDYYPWVTEIDPFTMGQGDWARFGGGEWERDRQNGRFHCIESAPGNSGYYRNDFTHSDYIFQTDFRVDDPLYSGAVGVVFRYVDENNYFFFTISQDFSKPMQLRRMLNGSIQNIGNAMQPFPWEGGKVHTIDLSVQGNRVKIKVDGRPQYDVTT